MIEPLEARVLLAAMYIDSNGEIHDGGGNVWVMRGVNQTFWWNTGTTADITNQIAAARSLNSNAIRAVFNATETWSLSHTSAQRQDYVRKINDQGMVAVYELHDATGKTDAASLSSVVDVIRADMSWLRNLSNKVVINIANEWGPALDTGNSAASWNGYVVPYVNAVRAIVEAGWDGLIMIDAPGWGRDQLSIDWWWDDIRAQSGYQNIVYSWHPYGASTSTITNWLQYAKNNRLPVVVAEYAYTGTQYVPYDSGIVLDELNSLDIGHVAWMWQADGYLHNMLLPDTTNFTDISSLSDFGLQVKAKSLDNAIMPVFGTPSAETVYTDSLAAGWSDWSWETTRNLGNTSPVRAGSNSAAVTYTSSSAGFALRRATEFNTSGFTSVKFWVHGGTGPDKSLRLYTQSTDSSGNSQAASFTARSNAWTEVTIPLSALGNPAVIKRLNFQNTAANGQVTVYFDDIRLSAEPLNQAPSDIALTPSAISENRPAGSVVGVLSTADPDPGNSFTYSLVSGAGSTDNALFTVVGNELRTAAVLDYENASSHTIRLRSTDQGGLFVERSFTIGVTDVDEIAPAIVSTTISGGAVQRSMLKQLGVNFSEPVQLAIAAITVKLSTGAAVPNTTITLTNPSGDQQTYILTFSGSAVIGGSLPDGIYDLLVSATGVQDLAGNPLTANYSRRFHRLFGDSDGNKVVNALDYARLKNTFARSPSDPLFNSAFDYEANNLINALDLARFRQRYGLVYSY